MPPSQDIKSTFDGFNAVLVLKTVTPNAIGCYECIAISSKKEEVQTSCVLTVQCKSVLETLIERKVTFSVCIVFCFFFMGWDGGS